MTTRGVTATLSPSMDIQVSSNFERLLFEMNERNGVTTAEQMDRFRSAGTLDISRLQYDTWIGPIFKGARCDDASTIATMADVYRRTEMLIDPHTAVGVAAAREHARSGLATVTLATAHPAKFPDAVIRATGVRPTLPAHLAELMDLPETTTVLPGELSTIENFVRSVAGTP